MQSIDSSPGQPGFKLSTNTSSHVVIVIIIIKMVYGLFTGQTLAANRQYDVLPSVNLTVSGSVFLSGYTWSTLVSLLWDMSKWSMQAWKHIVEAQQYTWEYYTDYKHDKTESCTVIIQVQRVWGEGASLNIVINLEEKEENHTKCRSQTFNWQNKQKISLSLFTCKLYFSFLAIFFVKYVEVTGCRGPCEYDGFQTFRALTFLYLGV